MAVLQRFILEQDVIISVSMLDRSCDRVKFLRAFAYLNTISKRKSGRKRAGTHLQPHCDTLAELQFFALNPVNLQ
jgi:hypothetical protein